ncbi:MAG: translocation protein TolB, partial [Stackebrandtia sp.]
AWAYDPGRASLESVGANRTASGFGTEVYVITADRTAVPLARLTGHEASEITGPAFSPDGRRLYFSSQRGLSGNSTGGITYEVTGPF